MNVLILIARFLRRVCLSPSRAETLTSTGESDALSVTVFFLTGNKAKRLKTMKRSHENSPLSSLELLGFHRFITPPKPPRQDPLSGTTASHILLAKLFSMGQSHQKLERAARGKLRKILAFSQYHKSVTK